MRARSTRSEWPEFDPSAVTDEETTMVVQINGKVRATIEVSVDVSEEEMLALALASEKVQGYLGGKDPDKVIARPPKLLSLVLKG